MIYFYLECDALDNDIRSLFMAFYPGRAIKRIETKEYACAEGDLFLRVCMSDCAETQCLANEDNTKKKMTMELMQDGTLLEDACECELSDRKDTKTKAKCMLYCLLSKLTKKELHDYVGKLEKEMRQAAADLQFERAAELRDLVFEYRARM